MQLYNYRHSILSVFILIVSFETFRVKIKIQLFHTSPTFHLSHMEQISDSLPRGSKDTKLKIQNYMIGQATPTSQTTLPV